VWPRKHSFNVKLVKDQKDAVVDSPAIDYNAVAKSVGKVIAIYMASDTIRKIVVHTVATKIT
jgi:hypothetical protein